MVELLRTTNPAELAWIEALMADAGIAVFVLDTHMSILEGSIGALPRRVMVADGDAEEARRLLDEADTDTAG